MLEKIKNFQEKYIQVSLGTFSFMALILILLAIAFYFVLGRGAKTSLVEQMLHREQIIARSGAASIEEFFKRTGKGETTLVETTNITQEDLDVFIDIRKDLPIGGIGVTDASGRFTATADPQGVSAVGVDISDRDYFIWAKTAKTGEVFISSPVTSRGGSTLGDYIVLVVVPVIKNGEFKGVLATAVDLNRLTEDYLKPLLISENTRIYLINTQGTILASNIRSLIGVNYLDYIAQKPFLGDKIVGEELRKRLAVREEGKLNLALPNEREEGKLTPFLIAYSPVVYKPSGDFWLLAVATPESDALLFISPIYTRQIMIFVLVFFAILILAVRFSKATTYREATEVKSAKRKVKASSPEE